MLRTKSGRFLTEAEIEGLHDRIHNEPLKFFGVCPYCDVKIPLFDRKDFESLSKIEMFHHLVQNHYEEHDKWMDENPRSMTLMPLIKVEYEK